MQFIDTPIYLFQIKNLFWQTSIVTMLGAFLGCFLLFKSGKKYRLLWPLLFYSFLYFAYVGSCIAKFIVTCCQLFQPSFFYVELL
jgi:hypothetical protein